MPRLSKSKLPIVKQKEDLLPVKLYRDRDGKLSSIMPPLSCYTVSNRAIYREIVEHCKETCGVSGKSNEETLDPSKLCNFDPLDSPSHPFNSETWIDLVKEVMKKD